MIRLRILLSTTLCLLLFKHCGHAQSIETKEAELKQEVTDFYLNTSVEKYGGYSNILEDGNDNLENPVYNPKNPFLRDLNTFYNQHADDFASIRQQKLQEFTAPPRSLPGYKEIDMNKLNDIRGYMNALYSMAHVIALQVFGPEDVYNYIIVPFDVLNVRKITQKTTADGGKIFTTANIQVNKALGVRLYAEHTTGDDWHLLTLSRLSAADFHWNTRNNQISQFHWLKYEGKKQSLNAAPPNIKQQPKDALGQFKQQANDYAWNLYDDTTFYPITPYDRPSPMDGEGVTPYLEHSLQGFVTKHRDEYVKARTTALNALSKFPDTKLESNWQLLDFNGDSLKKATAWFLTNDQYLKPYPSFKSLDAQILTNRISTLFTNRNLYKENNEGQNQYQEYDKKQPLDEYYFGRQCFARKTGKDTWEITATGLFYAYRFEWNVRTDKVGNITCWKSRKIN